MSFLNNFYNNYISENSPLAHAVQHPFSQFGNYFDGRTPTASASPMPAASQTLQKSQMAPWQTLGYPSQEAYNADNGITPDLGMQANQQGTTLTQLANPTPPPAPYVPKPAAATNQAAPGNNIYFLNGKGYDLNNPNQGKQYFNDRATNVDQMARDQLAPMQKQLEISNKQADQTYGEQSDAIKRDLGNLGDQYTAYNHNYDTGIYNANQGYDLGAVNRQNMFAQASPNAFQSSQGSGEQYARTQLDKELGDMAYNKSLTDKNYNQQEAGLKQQFNPDTNTGDLATNYNLFKQQSQNSLDQWAHQMNTYYGAQKDLLSNGAIQAYGGANPDIGKFNFTAQTGQPLQGVNTDTSQYSPYTNFQQLQSSPQANFFGSFQPQVTPPAQSPLQQNLGQVPTNQDRSQIQNYLPASQRG